MPCKTVRTFKFGPSTYHRPDCATEQGGVRSAAPPWSCGSQ